MFIRKEKYISYNRAQIPLSGYIGQTVASKIPENLIACMEKFAAEMLVMESNLVANGFNLLTRLDRGTAAEGVFQTLASGGIRTHVFTTEPLQPPYVANSNLTINAYLPIGERYYKFGDAETIPIYFKVTLGFQGTSTTALYARPYLLIEFFQSEGFISASNYWISHANANYNLSSPGSGARPFSLCFAANSSNLIISLGTDQGSISNIDFRHWGYVDSPIISEHRVFRPILFSKAHAPDVDLGDKNYIAVVHTSPVTRKTGTSNGEDSMLIGSTSTVDQTTPAPMLFSALSSENFYGGVGIPRTVNSNYSTSVRVAKPFFMDYFVVTEQLGVIEFHGLKYAPIMDRINFNVQIGTIPMRGITREFYQMPCIGPLAFEFNSLAWQNRAHTISLVADE